jgi:hypothetical protein
MALRATQNQTRPGKTFPGNGFVFFRTIAWRNTMTQIFNIAQTLGVAVQANTKASTVDSLTEIHKEFESCDKCRYEGKCHKFRVLPCDAPDDI